DSVRQVGPRPAAPGCEVPCASAARAGRSASAFGADLMSLTADNAATDRHRSTSAAPDGVVAARLDSESIEPAAWDELAATFDGVVQEQLNVYAATRWRSTALEARLFRLHGEVVGGALMMIQHLPLHLCSIAICKW